ncbi:MAG: hypothetical protein GY796_07725 [Chloroflexi bacterium]|nr:hypothetical protein [Chloroflexota bacterium]
MLVISDTNILSSLAAGGSLALLFRLFPNRVIYIPPAVHQELQVGLDRGVTHLNPVLQAIAAHKIQSLDLSDIEQQIVQALPEQLNLGECEAIALSQNRKARLLSNDKRAVRYCQEKQIKVVNLADLLRQFWVRRLVSQAKVKQLIEEMERVEKLVLNPADRAKIFAPRSRRHHRRKSK